MVMRQHGCNRYPYFYVMNEEIKTRSTDSGNDDEKVILRRAARRRRQERFRTFALSVGISGVVALGVSRVSEVQGSNKSADQSRDLCEDNRAIAQIQVDGINKFLEENPEKDEASRKARDRQMTQRSKYQKVLDRKPCGERFKPRSFFGL